VIERRIRLKEAAARVGVTHHTLRRWAKRGLISHYLIGPGQYMEFDQREVEAFIVSMRRERATPPVE
jgi:excisionase family DNA binding protein